MQWPVRRPAGRGFGCLSVWLWRLPPSARWGARSACLPARRAATQMAATKAAAQTGAPETADAGSGTGGSDVDDGVGDWDASSGTGNGNACGGCEAVEDPRCTGAGDPSSASCYATADESLATGSN